VSGPLPDDVVDGHSLVANVVAFGRMLHNAGLEVGPNRTRLFAQVLTLTPFDRRADVKAAGRAVFVTRHEQRAVFDAAFDLFFQRGTGVGRSDLALPRIREHDAPAATTSPAGARPGDAAAATEVVDATRTAAATTRERIRSIDFAALTTEEAREAAALVAAMRVRLPSRPSRRQRVQRHGRPPALRSMLRHSLGTEGEVLRWRWLRRLKEPRPIVLVLDVSGSMERYSRFLLRFAHAITRVETPVEVFVFGTRLVRITRELRGRDSDEALRRVARKVTDWNGGTRIGASLHTLNRDWVRRCIRSGAIVLIVSDGWERDEIALLEREMAALRRACHTLLWLDPLASRPGFEPTARGLQAALPFVDALVPCGNVASLEDLAARLELSPRPFQRRPP
jgi:uncharacterized protein with von Willebrand factor type A (vWA) domain